MTNDKMTLDEMQKKVWQNKVNKNFNTTNVEKEFCYIYGEVGEAYEAYLKQKPDLGAEIADVAIYLMGLSEMLGFSLNDEITKKMKINEERKYKTQNGILERIKEDSK